MGYAYKEDGGDEMVQDAMLFATNHGDLYQQALVRARQSKKPEHHALYGGPAIALGWATLANSYLRAYSREVRPEHTLSVEQALRFTMALHAYYVEHLAEIERGE
jgi:hypothetical protein